MRVSSSSTYPSQKVVGGWVLLLNTFSFSLCRCQCYTLVDHVATFSMKLKASHVLEPHTCTCYNPFPPPPPPPPSPPSQSPPPSPHHPLPFLIPVMGWYSGSCDRLTGRLSEERLIRCHPPTAQPVSSHHAEPPPPPSHPPPLAKLCGTTWKRNWHRKCGTSIGTNTHHCHWLLLPLAASSHLQKKISTPVFHYSQQKVWDKEGEIILLPI